MPKTIDEFKTAFSTRVRPDVLKQRNDQVAAALKEFKSSTEEFERAGGAGEAFRGDLVGLVKKFDAARNETGRPKHDIAADLETIHGAVIAKISEIARALATVPNGSTSTSAGAATVPSAAPPADEKAKKQQAYETARKPALAKLDDCLVVGRSYSSLAADRTALLDTRDQMEAAAQTADYDKASQLADELDNNAAAYLKKAAAEQKKYDKKGDEVLKSIEDACWFSEDNVTREWVDKLTPEEIKFLPQRVRNRMMEELHEGIFSDDDKKAMKKLYSVRTLDAAFEKEEKKHRDELIEKLRNDPEIKKARADWPTLGKEEKMKLLEKVANYHVEAYGTKKAKGAKPLKVKAYDKEPEKDADGNVTGWNNGVYNHSTGTITINTNSYSGVKFNDFDKALDLVTHEAGHRYQAVLADRVRNEDIKPGDPEYDQAVAFMWNDEYYVDEPYTAYENQPMEAHSRISGAAIDAANIGT